jgi:hypothetical protein
MQQSQKATMKLRASVGSHDKEKMIFQRRDWSGRLVYVIYDFECIASELC